MAERSSRILLVDDEQAILTLLSYPLRKDGYEVVPASDGMEALNRFAESRFDLVVLDVMMPRLDGLEVCRRLRAASSVPIIMLTAKAEEIDKVLGLELGADDYITKPFSMREFRSRVKAALRRAGMGGPGSGGPDASSRDRSGTEPGGMVPAHEEEPLHAGELSIDFAKRSVRVRGEHVQTTFVEFEILGALAQSPGRVFTRDMLLARIWGDSAYRDPRTIDVHIRHLREKVELDAKEPEYLFTVRGVGYRFRDSDE
jgi:DNA-binding response OmpR family regulator